MHGGRRWVQALERKESQYTKSGRKTHYFSCRRFHRTMLAEYFLRLEKRDTRLNLGTLRPPGTGPCRPGPAATRDGDRAYDHVFSSAYPSEWNHRQAEGRRDFVIAFCCPPDWPAARARKRSTRRFPIAAPAGFFILAFDPRRRLRWQARRGWLWLAGRAAL